MKQNDDGHVNQIHQVAHKMSVLNHDRVIHPNNQINQQIENSILNKSQHLPQ